MAEFLQLLIIGLSQGCVYGLIAMGFVMIYKATEMVNFAQGDIMMLGAFCRLHLNSHMGFQFLARPIACDGVNGAFRFSG